MNMVSAGTAHFRREKHPFDVNWSPFPGGVWLRFRLPKEHIDAEEKSTDDAYLVIAEQSGYMSID